MASAAATSPAVGFGGLPRVNLMPRAEIERRERGIIVRRWVWALVGALLVVAAATAGAFWMQLMAAQRLVTENLRTTTLMSELAGLSDVRHTLDLEADLSAFRQDAMATDMDWTRLLAQIDGVLPDGVAVAGFAISPAGVPTGDDPALEVGANATITLVSENASDIVPVVRELRALPGVIEADAWQNTAEEDGFEYEIRAALDQSVYTGEYAATEEVEG